MKAFNRFLIAVILIMAGGIAWLAFNPPVQENFEPEQEHIRTIRKFEKRMLKNDSADNVIGFELLRETYAPFRGPIQYPQRLLELDGKTVRMVGFMTPYDDLDIMKNFMVMNMSVGCNFCAPPEMEEVVFVRQLDEKGGFVDGAILVEGTLKLDLPDRDPDPLHDTFFYVIDGARVTALE